MGMKIILRTDLIFLTTAFTVAWDCSDRELQKTHTWCENGCCFEKDPVRCCTWAESMGSVFWSLMGLGAGMLILSVTVGIVCCCRHKPAFEGQVVSTRQALSRAQTSTQAGVRSTNQIPTAPYINTNNNTQTNGTIWTTSGGTGSHSATLTNRNDPQRFTNNTNGSTDDQRSASQPDTVGRTDQPPSYESLPPSYSSLFETNS